MHFNVPIMEASAMLLGLRLAQNLGIHDLNVESDFMEIINAILYPAEYRASGAVITDECSELLCSFRMATISHCYREPNVAAHELARFRSRSKLEEEWRDVAPSFLIPTIVKDMIVIE